MLNLIGLIPALADSIIYDFAKGTILTLIKKRADAGALPGLEAMIPGSPLIGMLNRAGRKSSADLAVVAGDIVAGGGVWNTLMTWASDAFYWQDNDLVVNTRAMYGGLERPSNAVYYTRSAPDMNHLNYFGNDQSRAMIYRWLTHKAGEAPEEFHLLAQVRERARARARAALPADAPVVILIPGVFASHLKAGSQRIWIDLESLAAGKLDRLALDKAGGKRQAAVKPDGIVEEGYADLIDALSARFQVMPFAYDWRKSLSSEVEGSGGDGGESAGRQPQSVPAGAFQRRAAGAGADGVSQRDLGQALPARRAVGHAWHAQSRRLCGARAPQRPGRIDADARPARQQA